MEKTTFQSQSARKSTVEVSWTGTQWAVLTNSKDSQVLDVCNRIERNQFDMDEVVEMLAEVGMVQSIPKLGMGLTTLRPLKQDNYPPTNNLSEFVREIYKGVRFVDGGSRWHFHDKLLAAALIEICETVPFYNGKPIAKLLLDKHSRYALKDFKELVENPGAIDDYKYMDPIHEKSREGIHSVENLAQYGKPATVNGDDVKVEQHHIDAALAVDKILFPTFKYKSFLDLFTSAPADVQVQVCEIVRKHEVLQVFTNDAHKWLTLSDLRYLMTIIKLKPLAELANINANTLNHRVIRGAPELTAEESEAIRTALDSFISSTIQNYSSEST